MKKVGIFGIGCIGSILTKYLSMNKSNEYYYFNRSLKDQISIRQDEETKIIEVKMEDAIIEKLNWLIICLKEYHTAEALPKLRALISKNTKIAIFRNGINLAEAYVHHSDPNNILETIIDCPTQREGDEGYYQLRSPIIKLPQNPLASEFIELFPPSDVEFVVTKDFIKEQWKKLIESSAIGSIQARTKKTCIIFEDENILNEYTKLIQEGIAVAKSEGILAENFERELILKLKTYPKTKGSSMLSDLLMGKPLELEAKIGAIVKTGIKNRVSIPASKKIYHTLLS